jgi:hypothetical protein
MPIKNSKKSNHHNQDLEIKNPGKRHRKKLGLIAGACFAVSVTLPETFFLFKGETHKRIEVGSDSSNIPILKLPADNAAGVVFVPPDTEVVIIAA